MKSLTRNIEATKETRHVSIIRKVPNTDVGRPSRSRICETVDSTALKLEISTLRPVVSAEQMKPYQNGLPLNQNHILAVIRQPNCRMGSTSTPTNDECVCCHDADVGVVRGS